MAWTAPRTWVSSEIVTAALMNTHVRDNLLALYGTWDRHLLFTDATYDIGAAGATRPRKVYTSSDVTVGGLLTVSGFGTHVFSAAGTGSNTLSVRNPTGGTGNYARVQIGGDGSADTLNLIGFSSSFSTSGMNVAGGGRIEAAESGGLSIAASHASGAIRFYAGGTTEYMRLGAAGDLAIAYGKKLCFDGVAGTGNTYIVEANPDYLDFYAGGTRLQFGPAYFSPTVDNSMNLGADGLKRWIAVYAVNGTIQTSDRTMKHDIAPSNLGPDFLRDLKPSEFTYRDMPERRYGLIAQDVIAAARGRSLAGVVTGEEGSYGLNYAALVTPLVSGWQSHDARIEKLESQLDALKAGRN